MEFKEETKTTQPSAWCGIRALKTTAIAEKKNPTNTKLMAIVLSHWDSKRTSEDVLP